MIPIEILKDSPRFQKFTHENFDKERILNLDLLDEVCDRARINSEALKRKVKVKYKIKVNHKQFRVSNLVLRKAHPYQIENKLSPKWTGPYRVIKVLGNRAYQLETLDGGPSPEPEMG